MMGTRSIIAAAIALAAGCNAPPAELGQTSDGFRLILHDEQTIEADLADGGATLHVLIVESQPGIVDITYDFGDPVIAFAIDYNQGIGDFMPSGAPLDAAQQRLIDLWLEHLEQSIEVDPEQQTRVEQAAVRQTSFMQIVPTGEPLVAGQYKSERGWRHISCSCKRQYIGGGYYRTCGKGCGCRGGWGNGCKGRCGQGCGRTSYPRCYGSTAYTRDCARHDYGLASWWSASDDFSFASNNCSCGGTGSCY